MAKVEIYSSMFCGFCHAAKSLLKSKGVAYTEIDVLMKPNVKSQMIERAGGRSTVPQIFIGGAHVGGYDDLAALEANGELDALLSAA